MKKDYIPENAERRFFCMDSMTTETRDNGTVVVKGHGSVFNTLSENLGGFREQVADGAFDDVLEDDARALFNHDRNIVLGRHSAGTLRFGVDKTGLWYEYDSPDTQAARDLLISYGRGDVKESSFAFIVDEEKWDEDEDGLVTRTIIKLKKLLDVSPVTYAAYPQADVGLRSLEHWKEERTAAQKEKSKPDYQDEHRKLRLDIAEAE